MSSNSKLNPDQKCERKAWLADLPKGATIETTSCGVTVLAVPDGVVTRLYSSVSSGDEKKIRRKVGEYWALSRWAADVWLRENGHNPPGFFLPGRWTAGEVLAYLGLYVVE